MHQREEMIEWFARELGRRGIDFSDTRRMYDFDAPDNRASGVLLAEADRRFRLLFNRPLSPLELSEAFYSACFYRNRLERLTQPRNRLKRALRRLLHRLF